MFGNGVGIGLMRLIIKVVQIAIRRVQVVGLTASFVAAAGQTTTTAVWIIATTIVMAIVTSIWASSVWLIASTVALALVTTSWAFVL